ncbi:sigma-70 family RNA polymerase sigma factor [Seongchinamella unica]|uniref:sigma-70 family RNA polymerase sigma factor n=1 Tax=Seongchinamella unica TaxID=2547392 RepID=UPI001EED0284|nr:sigma-70 family RNA polymerase sigma factor [Seongchinamella unica]
MLAAIAPEAMPDAHAEQYAEDELRWSALMVSAQAGNESDYRQLLGELSALVSGYLHSRLGGYDFVEDCAQEVLVAVHEARHTYDGRRPFRPWLFAIIRYKSTDAIRRAEVRGRHFGPQGSAVEPATSGPDEELDEGRLLAQLPESLRLPLELTKIVGLSTAEAAQRLGISESALKVRVHRAVKRLRKWMETEQP